MGQRIDPDFTQKIGYLNSITSKYPFIQIKELIKNQPQYGANEEAIEGDSETGVRYIRITDIDDLGNLKNGDWKTANNIDMKYLLNENDILFARSGSVGKCYIHKDISIKAIFAGYLIRFVFDSKRVNPDYIFYYCNSKLYWQWISAIQRPAVQSNINSEEFKSLLIPLPSLEKQNEIVEQIAFLRQKAFNLKNEAIEILKLAKENVEQIILGD